jgi:hypothetical protein
MYDRAEWAVTAAEHLLEALKAIATAEGHAEAHLAASDAVAAYRWALFCIGTIPGNRAEDVYDATIFRGVPVTQALDEIGA